MSDLRSCLWFAVLATLSASAFVFDDEVVRSKFFPLAAAAYSDDPSVCAEKTFNDFEIVDKVKVKCGEGYVEPENCFGFIGVSHEEKAVFLAFRGTHGLIQLIYEAHRTVFKKQISLEYGGSVSEYFYDVYRSILDSGLGDSLSEAIEKYPQYKIWITGHSLGGAMASIAASDLVHYAKVDSKRIHLVTFGQPRTGDKLFAEAHDGLVKNKYRVTHGHDVVPHVPPQNFEGFFHHTTEVWYNNNMKAGANYTTCEEQEDKRCSNKNIFNLSILSHLFYYNIFVSDYGQYGCNDAKIKMMPEELYL